jgi:pimeloyl-ACP methyl ester carboxylesterase
MPLPATQLFLLPGMTPDVRLFDRLLPLLPGAVVVPWIEPRKGESIPQYAERLAETVAEFARIQAAGARSLATSATVVCGVSFGGIVARELAHVISARGCILVSSVRTPAELPPWFRAMRYSPIRSERVLSAVGSLAQSMPRQVRTRSTARLTKLAGSGGAWHRWATAAVLRWRPRPELDEIATLHIHGDADETFPLRYVRPDVVIRGGGHVLPLTHAEELAQTIAQFAAQPNGPSDRPQSTEPGASG